MSQFVCNSALNICSVVMLDDKVLTNNFFLFADLTEFIYSDSIVVVSAGSCMYLEERKPAKAPLA